MRYTRWILPVSMLSVAFLLLLAFGLERYWVGAIAAAGLGLWGWYDLKKRAWTWAVDLFLVGAVILVTVGAIMNLRPYLLLPALLFALVFWDVLVLEVVLVISLGQIYRLLRS